jgi:hypothetical protein
VGVPLVTLHVDPKRSVQVHQCLLDDASPGFVVRSNITPSGLEGNANINLIREDEDMIDVLVAWLYAGPEGSLASVPPLDRFLCLARLHTFAERYGLPTLQNDIITELFILQRDGYFPPLLAVHYVFNRMGPNSTLAILMVAWHVFHLDMDCLPSMEEMEDVPSFAARLARAYMDKLKNQFDDPFEEKPEKFFVRPLSTDTAEECLDVRPYDSH